LVDDHRIVRDGLTLLLRQEREFEIVDTAVDTESAWNAVVAHRPDVVITDAAMPGAGGIALTEQIRREYPQIKVILLTAFAEPSVVNGAVRAGAAGYLLKTSAGTELIAAVRAAMSGQVYLCTECATIVVSEYQKGLKQTERSELSAREKEILIRIANGNTTKEIAFALEVSAKTIESHRINLMTKLGLNSVAELTKYAIRNGLIKL
jgi:DNA-binding NarL/FixJ family response regulator